MSDTQKIPLYLQIAIKIIDKIKVPCIPEKPRIGKWYRVPMEGYVSSDGSPYFFHFRKGTENKLIVFLQGGGVSWNEYMAARPTKIGADNLLDCYYFPTARDYGVLGNKGIFSNKEENPFKNWNMISLPYCTGDFHCGTADFPYVALDGSNRILHHHGALNLKADLKKAMQWCGEQPEQILVAGCSAGGFGTAFMTDTVVRMFSKCDNIISLVDSGLLYKKDWKEIAQNVWKASDQICDRLHSDCFTLDCMKALKDEHGEKVKILLTCSVRDLNLAQLIGFEMHGRLYADRQIGLEFQTQLKNACEYLKTEIPDAGVFLFDTLVNDREGRNNNLTQHCILLEENVFTVKSDNMTCMEWLTDVLNGTIRMVGLDLLTMAGEK